MNDPLPQVLDERTSEHRGTFSLLLVVACLAAGCAGGAILCLATPALPSLLEGRLDVTVHQVPAPNPEPDPPAPDPDKPDRSAYPEITARVPDWVRDVEGEPNYVRAEARQLAEIFAGAARRPADRAELLDDLQAGIDAEFDQQRQDAWEPFNVAFADAAAEWSRSRSDREPRSDREWADLVIAVAIGLVEVSR